MIRRNLIVQLGYEDLVGEQADTSCNHRASRASNISPRGGIFEVWDTFEAAETPRDFM